ncbi:peptide chain release factor N(5)-glutamine methyltransferase [Sphingobium subterraneum]|uniref:Release factor glutamine methyltransferase n=1 Tax=Sphingobium subterraneum TaxID=627688 RepID=A0A841IYB6_9SPHN|nr:release factor glutamine methyltransferase [Sphingobium subterraneum]
MTGEAAQSLRDAATRIATVSDTPRLDAELLMAHAAGITREELILHLHRMDVPPGFAALVERRMDAEPVSHITGTRDFWTLTLRVSADVLTPRPDSETLVEVAVAHFAGRTPPQRILDLGTGSGALLLAALDEWRDATGLGVDLSQAALDIAGDNARRTGMADRASFAQGNWGEGLDTRFDLILANPPYISTHALLPRDVADHEPHLALFAGADGLDAYRVIAPQVPGLLAPAGIAVIEIGFDQGESAAALFAAEGLAVALHRDLGGRARCLSVQMRNR